MKAGKILKKTKIGLIDFSDFSSVDGTGDREMFNQMYLDLWSIKSEVNDHSHKKNGPMVKEDMVVNIINYLNL